MAHWDPRQVLDVYPQQAGFTCIGTTTKGLRCRQSFLKNSHKAQADRLLHLLPSPEQFTSHPNELFRTLRHIAWLSLCPRWHQNGARCQADAVAARWLQIIIASVPISRRYFGSQAPTIAPLSPPQSPLPAARAVVGVAQHLPTYNTRPAVIQYPSPYNNQTIMLPPSPPSSPTQRAPGTALEQEEQTSATDNSSPRVSSSIRSTQRNGPIRIDLNLNVVLHQPVQSNVTHGTSSNAAGRASVSNHHHSRHPILSNRLENYEASGQSRYSSSSANNRVITTHDIQNIVSRLEFLDRQIAQFISGGRSASSSRSSTSSYGTSRRTANDPRSPVGSTISDLYLPPPIGPPGLFFSPPRSPPPIPHAGALSISTDSEPESSVANVTPSSSGSATPAVLQQPVTTATAAVRVPGPATLRPAIQRRPITATTTCYICYDLFQSPLDAVWCRGTCGQNVCLHCFDEWIGSRDGFSINCPYCRQPWLF